MASERRQSDDEIDRLVGANLRKWRGDLGLSRKAVATCLGVTAQQVAKYEQGQTRISASTLFALSRLLGVEVNRFFIASDGEGSGEDRPPGGPHGPGHNKETDHDRDLAKFLKVYSKIKNAHVRHRLLEVIRSLGAMQD